MAITVITSSVAINAHTNGKMAGHIVLYDPVGDPTGTVGPVGIFQLWNNVLPDVSDDNPTPVQFTAQVVKTEKNFTRMTIRLTRKKKPKGKRITDDESCPDGGNFTVTLTGGTGGSPPTQSVSATYTTDDGLNPPPPP
jgi:hypothetical protein